MAKMLNTKELAELLRVPIGTILKYTHERKIPYYKIGRHNFYKEDEIMQWLETKKRGVES